jgi:hypothetical protein
MDKVQLRSCRVGAAAGERGGEVAIIVGTPARTRTGAHGLGRGEWPSNRSNRARKSGFSALSTLF